ncbi:WSC domain-containing protein ARB_07867 {ECO:0000305} Flags: Precursor [Serendipita indica DSM 11827]|nr:WSC domain-containing protein ARB_07867 {ECO:0000305} Flags: Precursor [Serendipita indica DSM 11827]
MVAMGWSVLLPLLTSANALIFELPSHTNAHKRAHRRSLNSKRAAPNLRPNWSYQGCYADAAARTLTGASFTSDTMTVDACVGFCADQNYMYAGTEYSRECFCGHAIENNAGPAGECSMMCNGDASQVCGDGYKLSLYKYGIAPQPLASYNGYSYQGCYTDTVVARSLANQLAYSGALTPAKCLDACKAQGYAYCGLEYAHECFGANVNSGTVASDATTCNMACSGDSSALCGGGNRLTLYRTDSAGDTTTTTGWSSLGCYADLVYSRSLPVPMGISGLTVEKCQTACQSANFMYAGVEYGGECYCGNSIGGSGPVTDGRCNMRCNGNNAQTCGGSNGLNIYKLGTILVESTSSFSVPTSIHATSTSTSTSTSSSSSTPSPPASQSTSSESLSIQETRSVSSEPTVSSSISSQSTVAPTQSSSTDSSVSLEQESSQSTQTSTQTPTSTGQTSTSSSSSTYESSLVTQSSQSTTSTSFSTQETATSTETPSDTQISSSTIASSSDSTQASTYTDQTLSSASTDRTLSSSTVSTPTSVGSSTSTSESSSSSTDHTPVSTSSIEGSTSTSSESSTSSTESSTSTSESSGSSTAVQSTSSSSESTSGSGTSSSVSTSVFSTSTSTQSTPSATPTAPYTLQTYSPSYSTDKWVYQGCYSDLPATRTLAFTANVNGLASPQICADTCYRLGYSYAAVEWQVECYCGNEILNGATKQSEEGCNSICSADQWLFCGGAFRISLYKFEGVVPTPVVNPNNNANNVPGVVNPSLTPLTTGLPGTWSYQGCWVDNAQGRIMTYNAILQTPNEPLACIAACTAAGYTVSGQQFGVECWCSASLANGALLVADSECTMACPGDKDHGCGNGNRMTVYSATSPVKVYQPPKALKTNLPGKYQYAGCYAQPANALLMLPWEREMSDSAMTVQKCLSKCAAYGYEAATLELGSECNCGDWDELESRGGVPADESFCIVPCGGSPTDICGGVSYATVYRWDQSSDTPLFIFNKPTGDAAGRYEFLIGGVVIPLISTLGVNNKITFVEKFGTGVANSTGAYELDYTLANDFEKAWRPMHVKSDVFCAASFVLPDRLGRQLVVGGWSADSTEGVRFYTPDGVTGDPNSSKNDWEEDHELIRLQQGRWYPGGLQLVNGSILIIGGEEGSDGRPIPTIEILPKPPGGPTWLFMQWLKDSDPYNLYPFSAVLPSGGILVAYSDEARILDENTFETIRILPKIPGVMSILPQRAPYTDPLEVILCGGSAFGIALDNCASIRPEIPDDQWVLERMPSKRVMPIMTALPDGTFLIAGGATQGVGGFGLASKPNLGAILYDPSKPRHQRVSQLASTIVARMYHSELTLMHDGRVLVSGSDPQDKVNPQEYRMEVFTPPYLASGQVQPSFDVPNRDWAYGGTYTIVITALTGSISDLRISLVGASSTTHGNNFGQRTIFPQFSCAGLRCSITAPPNGYVAPPSWYQLFILDGPTPSHSHWVRIGGDPGQLGNWPNIPGSTFTLPGMSGPLGGV